MIESDLVLLEKLAVARGIGFRRALLPSREFFAVASGRKLSALRWRGRGPPLILLHGGALTAHTWDLMCLALDQDAECIAVDLAGHGHSDWSDAYSIDAGARDIAALVDRLSFARVHIAGMSLGGNIAFHFVAAHPQRASSLAMIDVGPQVNFGATANMRDFVDTAEQHRSLDALVDAALIASPRSDRDLIRYRYQAMINEAPDGSWTPRQDRRRPHDYDHILGKLREMPSLASHVNCPVLVVRGGRSRVLSDDDAREFAAMFGNGRTITIPDAGHNVQEDNPKALAEALRAMLASSER
jgi:pimeloyl-ACP methyl ester carboxylesterase